MMRTSSGHPRREVLAGSALAAVVAIALTACSPSPQPAAFPTASATPSQGTIAAGTAPTSSPSTTGTDRLITPPPTSASPAMRRVQIVGNAPPKSPYREAAGVVVKYLDAQFEAVAKRSTESMSSLASPGCVECQNDLSVAKRRIDARRKFVGIGGPVGWSSIVLYSRRSINPSTVTIRAEYVQRPQRLLESDGSLVGERRSAVQFLSTFVLSTSNDRYVIDSVSTENQ